MNWNKGFQRVAMVISLFFWGFGVIAFAVNDDFRGDDVGIVIGMGFMPWLVYGLGLFIAKGFQKAK